MFTAPEWQNAAQYPRPDAASNSLLAWEFLRRNPKYGDAWAQYWVQYIEAVRAAADSLGDPEVSSYVEAMAGSSATLKAWYEERPSDAHNSVCLKLIGHPSLCVTLPIDERRSMRIPLDRHCGERWGLDSIVDPASDGRSGVVRFRDAKECVFPTSHSLRDLEGTSPPGEHPSMRGRYLILQVDLTLPLKVIKETVMWHIETQRKYRAMHGDFVPISSRAQSPAKYVEYLRILDAVSAGASWHDIGECLAPHAVNEPPDRPRDKRLRAAAKQAEQLRDGGYRVLPLLQDDFTSPRSTKNRGTRQD